MEFISEVHTITAAARGWKIVGAATPVVCWALVTVIDPAHPSFHDKKVIPLSEENVNTSLLGEQVDPSMIVEFEPD